MVARRILAPLACAALACAAAPAHASPRSDPTAGRAVFTGATLSNVTSIGLNPAALGVPPFGEIAVALAGTLDHLRLDVAGGALSPGARVRTFEPAPGGLVGIVVNTGRYTLGVAAQVMPPERFLSGYDGLRYHTLGGGQREYVGTIAGAIRVTSRFHVGAHIAHTNTFLRLRYARDTALASGDLAADCGGAACGLGNPAADELYDVDVRSPYVSGTNLAVTVGLVAEVSRGVWLGVAYHTPPGLAIQTALEGDVEVRRAPREDGGRLRGASTVYVQYPASVDAELRARVTSQLDLHVGGRWEDLSRMQAYDVRAYGGELAGAGVPEWTLRPRGFEDAFALWAGIEDFERGQALRYGVRAGFETAAVDPGALSPLTVAPASFTVDAGLQVRFASAWALQLSYGLQLFPAVTVSEAGSAFNPQLMLDCIDSGYDYESRGCRAAREGYAISSAAGTYGRFQHALRLALRYDLP